MTPALIMAVATFALVAGPVFAGVHVKLGLCADIGTMKAIAQSDGKRPLMILVTRNNMILTLYGAADESWFMTFKRPSGRAVCVFAFGEYYLAAKPATPGVPG